MKTRSRLQCAALVLALLSLLSLTGCPSPGTGLVLALDGVAIAANAAVPFVGPYAPFVSAVAQAATAAATEVNSSDSSTLQLSKILALMESVVLQFPALANASPQTVAVIMAIEVAVQAVITLIQNSQKTAAAYAAKSPANAAKMKALASAPIQLNKSDAQVLLDIFKKDAATQAALAGR